MIRLCLTCVDFLCTKLTKEKEPHSDADASPLDVPDDPTILQLLGEVPLDRGDGLVQVVAKVREVRPEGEHEHSKETLTEHLALKCGNIVNDT